MSTAAKILDTVQMHIPKFGRVCTVNAADIEYWQAQGATMHVEGATPADIAPTAPPAPNAPAAVITVPVADAPSGAPVTTDTAPIDSLLTDTSAPVVAPDSASDVAPPAVETPAAEPPKATDAARARSGSKAI